MTIIRIGPFEIDIDEPVREDHNPKELLLRILAELKHQQKHIDKRLNMIASEVIEATKTALNESAANIINHLPGNTTPSTPDSLVQGLIDNVNTNVAAMNAAAGPVIVPTPPPPTP